jgi:hypothetical protein
VFNFVCVVCLLFIMVFSKHGLSLNGTDWGPLHLCSGSYMHLLVVQLVCVSCKPKPTVDVDTGHRVTYLLCEI